MQGRLGAQCPGKISENTDSDQWLLDYELSEPEIPQRQGNVPDTVLISTQCGKVHQTKIISGNNFLNFFWWLFYSYLEVFVIIHLIVYI